MIKTKFVFAVSLVAMLAVGSAWAYDPADTTSTTDTVATEHTVYTNQTPTSTKDEGGTAIAGVSYVNRVVNKAGAAATAAEAHAAAAGASALAAADSAAEAATSAQLANDALTGMVSKDQGSTNANKAVITDESGNIKTGEITSGMIADKTIVNANISDDAAISTNKISGLAKVATSGSYTDLVNKPTIGTSSLIIKNGATNTNIATFGANATAAVTATIPAATASVAGLAKIGVIPSGFETASEYAAIWVE